MFGTNIGEFSIVLKCRLKSQNVYIYMKKKTKRKSRLNFFSLGFQFAFSMETILVQITITFNDKSKIIKESSKNITKYIKLLLLKLHVKLYIDRGRVCKCTTHI